MFRVCLIASIAGTIVPALSQAQGQALQITQSSTQRTYACQGDGVDSVQVTGSSDVLTITGACGSLQVTGSSNKIAVDSVRTIQVTGAGNLVTYQGGSRPTISDRGASNTVVRDNSRRAMAHDEPSSTDNTASMSSGQDGSSSLERSTADTVSSAMRAAAAAGEMAGATTGTVQGVQVRGNVVNIILSKQKTVQNCSDGANVNVNGYQDDITLTGSCNNIALNGWGNSIHVQEAAAIQIVGHDNTLTWERGRNTGKPAVQIVGGENNVVRHVTSGTQ